LGQQAGGRYRNRQRRRLSSAHYVAELPQLGEGCGGARIGLLERVGGVAVGAGIVVRGGLGQRAVGVSDLPQRRRKRRIRAARGAGAEVQEGRGGRGVRSGKLVCCGGLGTSARRVLQTRTGRGASFVQAGDDGVQAARVRDVRSEEHTS